MGFVKEQRLVGRPVCVRVRARVSLLHFTIIMEQVRGTAWKHL